MITNAAGRILTVNQAYTRITGYAPDEVLGQPRERIPLGDAAAVLLRRHVRRGAAHRPLGRHHLVPPPRRHACTANGAASARCATPRSAITHYVALFRELDSHGAGRVLEDRSDEVGLGG